jgi:dolichol kinase
MNWHHRRWGSVKWPFSKSKSYVGSLAFVIGGWIASVLILALMNSTGSLTLASGMSVDVIVRLLLISILCAAVELIAFGDDNVNVPLAGGILAALLIDPLLQH